MSARFHNTHDLGVGELGRPEWHLYAACRGIGADKFFSGEPDPEALKLCDGCPVIVECGHAGQTELFGVWAGQTRAVRRHSGAPLRPLKIPRCGTEYAYQRHLKRGETACPSCKEAHAARARENKQAAS